MKRVQQQELRHDRRQQAGSSSVIEGNSEFTINKGCSLFFSKDTLKVTCACAGLSPTPNTKKYFVPLSVEIHCHFLSLCILFFFNIASRFDCHIIKQKMKLRTGSLGLSLLISSQFKLLASLNTQRSLRSAGGLNTFNPQHDLCSFSHFFFFWKIGLFCPP